MGKETYVSKMNAIINLSQFKKVVKNRKNVKQPILKEQERDIHPKESKRKLVHIRRTVPKNEADRKPTG